MTLADVQDHRQQHLADPVAEGLDFCAAVPTLNDMLGDSSNVRIYHNPDCGTSRNTLAMIRQSGVEPIIIEYLNEPPSRNLLGQMIRDAGLSVHDAVRQKDTPYVALGLSAAMSDDDLLDAMMEHPILINRPFVVTEKGTRLCRPSEVVLGILPNPDIGPFIKEDGEVVIDEQGRRMGSASKTTGPRPS